jgi:circadian clock protein KaiB
MSTEEKFEKFIENSNQPGHYVLRLYIAGISPRSLKAIENLKKLCSKYDFEYDLEIIDIYQNPIIAKNGQILAAPTLIKELPLPLRKFIGDMSDTNKLVMGLDLKSKKAKNESSE